MKKNLLSLLVAISVTGAAWAQQSIENQSVSVEQRLKISGYIQSQFQWGEGGAALKVGAANENPGQAFNRVGIRRGRVKFAYGEGLLSAVFQLDITEKGVGVKDAYLAVNDPWCGTMALKAGVFDRPFGYEISYSSSRRESPERSTVFQTLFPDERDLGAALVLQAGPESPWNWLKLEAGLFAGNGIKAETDSKKDFIGHLALAKKWGRLGLGAGASYYRGGVFQGTERVWAMSSNGFVVNEIAGNKGASARREYTGFDLQLSLKNGLGMTRLNGEYLFGRQPGTGNSSKSPNAAVLPSADTYLRDFQGGYVMLVHEIANTPVAVAGKYDFYDPNTKIAGAAVGLNGTGVADLAQHAVGAGVIWNATQALRVTGWYDFNRNETSPALAGMERDRRDDVFTLRMQYKF